MLRRYLQLLLTKSSLGKDEAEAAMKIILDEADPHQIAAFLAILKYRGEKPEEVVGMLAAAEKRALFVNLPYPVLDIAGTGGDFANTVNISTGSAILAAACGVFVAKHGNRSVSSRSGSADVLEAFGIDIEIPPEKIDECIKTANIAFMYAPHYHPCLKKLAPIRRALKFPNLFNFLGLLLNPAGAEYSLIGVADPSMLELISKTILQMPSRKRTLVFHGSGLDELTTMGPIIAYDICEGQIKRLDIDPVVLGFEPCTLKELQGGDAQTNAGILTNVFAGQRGAVADALILNAGAALWVFGRVSTLVDGIEQARAVLNQGKALEILEKLKAFTKKIQKERKNENNELFGSYCFAQTK